MGDDQLELEQQAIVPVGRANAIASLIDVSEKLPQGVCAVLSETPGVITVRIFEPAWRCLLVIPAWLDRRRVLRRVPDDLPEELFVVVETVWP